MKQEEEEKANAVVTWHRSDAKNLLSALQAMEHPQYIPYKISKTFASKYQLDWLPIGLVEAEVKRFARLYSIPSVEERLEMVKVAMPIMDINMHYASNLTEYEKKVAQRLMKRRNQIDLGIGQLMMVKANERDKTCDFCTEQLTVRNFYVNVLEKHSVSKIWCLKCFKCTECNSRLPDFLYFWFHNKVYCLRHYGEKIRPRCHDCDQLIYSDEYTKAMKKSFHLQHFKCTNCYRCLTESKFVVRSEEAYCLNCYDELFSHNCNACFQKISCRQKGLSFKKWYWHENCFKCCICSTKLNGSPFAQRNDSIYCSSCYEQHAVVRCNSCQEVFLPGTRTFEFRNKRWHESCFACVMCRRLVGSDNFVPSSDDNPVCIKCHTKSISLKCEKCQEPILFGGVTYKEGTWHSSCFLCGHCKIELNGKKFTMKNDIPYCADCYGEFFAKRCSHCTKPITGFNSDQFVTFQDQYYHSACFNCYLCRNNLIKSGFVHYLNQFLCPDCGKKEKSKSKVKIDAPSKRKYTNG